MAKIVGISGAQGAGKSTLLNELKSRGWIVDDFKVSRAVQSQLGWDSLDRVLESPKTMMEFQREIHQQKTQREEYLRDQPGHIIFTERTFADICAYSFNWGWKFADLNQWDLKEAHVWASEISKQCFESQKLYEGVILLPFMADVVPWQDDPNRASRSSIDTIYEDIERFTQSGQCLGIKHFTITGKSVYDRAAQIELFTNTL